ncbi:MAG TPA: HAMP domain-containing sensor histidine kinase [Anaerolineales bacterium]|nr:HAMP domain-containing sensor histidine kinase [Anaerolineales bacterium]
MRLSERLRVLQWALPALIMLVAALYQLGPARYVHDNFGTWAHYGLEVFFYGTTGPIGVWITLRVVRGWVQQKEQAEAEVYRLNEELQARVEERTRELSEKAHALSLANAELQQLDRLKSEFVSLVSHEFRAPLTNMQGALELMAGDGPASDSAHGRLVGVLREQAARLTRMVDQVLDVSRIEAGGVLLEPRSVEVEPVLRQLVSEFATHDDRHSFEFDPAAPGLRVWADRDRLCEVLTNLLDNAVKYSPSGGPIRLRAVKRDAEAELSVHDAGPGIPLEEQSRIFEKFHRLDAGDSQETYGHGLGLYLSRRLTEAMGGRIWVESVPGEGSAFHVALPLGN